MKHLRPMGLALASLLCARPAAAFNGHVARQGPLTVTIGEVADVTAHDTPRDVPVTVANTGKESLTVRLRMGGLVDEWRAVGETDKRLDIAPGKASKATFRIAAGRGACSALYPVHVRAAFVQDGKERIAHAVQILAARLPRPAAPAGGKLPALRVSAGGALALAATRRHRVAWGYYDKPLVRMPVGWQGSAPVSSASFSVQSATRGTTKRAIHMHPPWKPGGGTIFAEYRLALPDDKPIELRFANAIRDHTAEEPPSDGVTFRVWAGTDEKHLERLFERHTLSKRWLEGKADLTRFAGKEILLRLESHPGPKRDTTCDSSFWAEPTVTAGRPVAPLTEAQRRAFRRRAGELVRTGRAKGAREFVFPLAGGHAAAIICGPHGLADGAIAFGAGDRCVVFDGLRVAVLGRAVWDRPAPRTDNNYYVERGPGGRLTLRHPFSVDGEGSHWSATLWAEGPALRVQLSCPKRITDVALGPADRKAPRVYYGHGYCIVEPEAFRAGFGGHNLATSHVGFDFDGGASLLTASNHPPDHLAVDPASRTYALHTHLDATLTFVPGTKGAPDCAIRYRPLYDKKPAGGFRRKAGRFVFDIWGGRYAEIADTMGRMIAYGLTDSLLTVHVWQRWGYDYRLPDIHPPNPALGSVEDMRKIAAVCKAHDVPWGLHDNYIDFYPDAEGYSYDHVCFTPGGRPVKAWINRGRDAQSYRWRPDRFAPFLKRNLKLIKPDLAPTHYFIDVFTSIGPFDFYDKQGRFHSMLETRKHWGEAFAWIREYLGGDAPMTSEAGHDQLTGWLDGADCQFLQLSPVGKRFCLRVPCRDWQRVPWFDAVLHDRFSLHGVGYSGRYQGGRSRRQAGIESDDYVSAELLTGHALMIDRGGFGRGAVRKYWLAQDLIRSIATDRIAGIEFAGGDIHRQIVTWESGAKVRVNRGKDDWTVAGRTLPQHGYLARHGEIESSIERIGGAVVEQSRSGSKRWYVNARGYDPYGNLAIRPRAERVEHLGGGRFRLVLSWEAARPAPRDLAVFLHFQSDRAGGGEQIAFQGDFRPAIGTSRWTGPVTTGRDRVIQVPADREERDYRIVVGLWDPTAGRRYPLLGTEVGSTGYLLGRLLVERRGGKVTNVRLVRHEPPAGPAPRWNVAGKPIDFGPAVTTGALRCERRKDALIVTPLPDLPPFDVTLRLDRLAGKTARVASLVAVDANGRERRPLEFQAADGRITFRTRKGEFAYRIALRPGGP